MRADAQNQVLRAGTLSQVKEDPIVNCTLRWAKRTEDASSRSSAWRCKCVASGCINPWEAQKPLEPLNSVPMPKQYGEKGLHRVTHAQDDSSVGVPEEWRSQTSRSADLAARSKIPGAILTETIG